MTRHSLEAAPDLVERLAREKDPVGAVIELIWNGLDADGHKVTVTIQRDEWDAVRGVTVQDDGHGMSPEECTAAFKRVGGSWKLNARRSQGEGRPLHGQSGQGRLRAFALGSNIRWTTVADNTAGKRLSVVISATDADRSSFDISPSIPTHEDSGTTFEATGKHSQHLNRLTAEAATSRVATALAPYLIAHPDVEVVYDGVQIRPQDNVAREDTHDFLFAHAGVEQEARLRIIEWVSGADNSLHLCDADGIPVDDVKPVPSFDSPFSAYILWAPMPEHRNEWLLGESEQTAVGALLLAARSRLAEHFDARRAEQRRQLVAEWKSRRTYPYRGEAVTDADRVERATFDVVATSIRRHIPKEPRKQRLTLGLLRNSLQHRPDDMTKVLDEVLGLPQDERDQLERLLARTSLSRVIRASTSVTDRLDFLAALEHLIFDPEAKSLTRERDHLHRMLERELWVFGEQYNMMISERSLTTVLSRHLAVLGRPSNTAGPVTRLDNSHGRVDLMLSAAATEHDRNRHLVIELKAPKVVATETELRQVKSYAKAVSTDPRFASGSTVWDFWLVASEIDEDVRGEVSQSNRARGLAYEPDLPTQPDTKVRVWVRTWSEILDEAKRRLSYFQESLQHAPSLEDALDYLVRQHGDVVPPDLLTRVKSVN